MDPPLASSAAKEPAPTAEHSVRGLGPFVPLDLFPPAELRPESFEVRSFRKGLIAVALLGRTATRLRGQEVEVLAVYPLELNDGRVSLGKPSVMPFSFATSIGEGVFLRSAGQRSALRIAPRLSIKPSGELENTWRMTWIEPVVPVRHGPPRLLPGSTLWETEDSFPLDAENIPRRVHQLRLDRQGKIKADKVITAGLSESDAPGVASLPGVTPQAPG